MPNMKKISILVPCYNEEENVVAFGNAVEEELIHSLPDYDYEIVFIDNHSKDRTQDLLQDMCDSNSKMKAIFNAKNFGQFNSPYYGLQQTSGDCTILMCCDFQDPVSMIPKFVSEWEAGNKVVIGIKTTSKENRIMRFFRTCYYRLIKKMSDVEQIEHFTGFGLYDRSFINTLRDLNDPTPFLRGIVAELGPDRVEIPYEQEKRRAGETHNNFFTLYDAAMLSFTSYTKFGLRLATIVGFALSMLSLIAAVVYLILKLTNWYMFPAGSIPVLLAVLVLGSMQLFFIGLLGEYILGMNQRIMNRPLVIEEKRINFDLPRPEERQESK